MRRRWERYGWVEEKSACEADLKDCSQHRRSTGNVLLVRDSGIGTESCIVWAQDAGCPRKDVASQPGTPES